MAHLAIEVVRLASRANEADQSAAQDYRDSCNWDTCPLDASYWGYRPSLGANLAFLILFGISTLAFIGQGFLNRAWLGFTIAMVCGCLLEVIGYIGRVLAHSDGFSEVWQRPSGLLLLQLTSHRIPSCYRSYASQSPRPSSQPVSTFVCHASLAPSALRTHASDLYLIPAFLSHAISSPWFCKLLVVVLPVQKSTQTKIPVSATI